MSIYIISVLAVSAVYMLLNFKFDIMMLQQNSYRISRFWKWVRPNITSMWRLVDVALLFLLFSTLLKPVITAGIIGIVVIVKCIMISRRKFKKPLVFTRRVWRIYALTAIISCGILAVFIAMASAGLCRNWWYESPDIVIPMGILLIMTTFSWAIVIVATVLLMPVESMINRRYINDARRILESAEGITVIGITGSYGKTSTKHYLTRILREQYDTLMTPGSFNTTMGVVRTIREHLRPNHTVFVCEMGAKQPGDVKEICDIVHPSIGIVTAVGPMHLETFGSIENVQNTKFELIDSLPADGLAVINQDFEYCANRPVKNVSVERYTTRDESGATYYARNIRYDHNGTSFTITGPDGFELDLKTKLVGECNISNLMASVIVARRLNVPAAKIQYAVSGIEQVEHRLNMKRTPGGVTIIDDAFNSNPTGSRMALDVLKGMSGRKIVVTPGMVELGDSGYELNRKLGEYIDECADIAVIVGRYNRKSLLDGLRADEHKNEKIIIVDSFAQAQEYLNKEMKKGDVILYENDLPDTYE